MFKYLEHLHKYVASYVCQSTGLSKISHLNVTASNLTVSFSFICILVLYLVYVLL